MMADTQPASNDPAAPRQAKAPPRWLPTVTRTGGLIAAADWSTSPLGTLEAWPAPLQHALQLCLESRLPLAVTWGVERTLLYNDAFATLHAGSHPHALGRNVRECWGPAWAALASDFEAAERGEACFVEDRPAFLQRTGGLQEAFFTLSFTPVRDDSGGVAGVLQSVVDTTVGVLAARRSRLLAEVMAAGAGASSVRQALELSLTAISADPFDVPFALVYGGEPNDGIALLARTRSTPEACCPPQPGGGAGSSLAPWPVADVLHSGKAQTLAGLDARFDALGSGPYTEPPRAARLLPIIPPGAEAPTAVLIVALSPRCRLDEPYEAFLTELAAALSASVGSARSQEQQRRRADQLSALDRAKTTFFSNISHEFRTPLTLLAGPIEDELAEREQPLPAPRRERLQTAHRNTVRLLKLVNVLLDFSRIEAGRTVARYQPTQLGTLTSELVSMFRAALERAGLTLTVEIEPLPEPIFVDREMWEKIVLNLMSNAFKHTFEGGIQVRLSCQSETVELEVADTGVGISSNEIPRLFERFHRVLGAQSRTHEGTGIGLALVRELSRLHGGDVRVDSTPGKGARFIVTVPRGCAHLQPEQIDANEAPSPSGAGVAAYVQEAMQWSTPWHAKHGAIRTEADATAEPSPGVHRAKILLADDNADMREYVKRILERSHQVFAVSDGQAALDLVSTVLPDLVLTDVMMPRLDGIRLLRALRGDPRTRQLPVILLSARAGEDAAIEGLESGADDYLVKPFSARELEARVRTHVELSRARREWAEHLERTNQELEAFSYSVSHDLRTPLRAIDGFSRAILTQKADQLDDQGRQYLQRVRKAAGRMGELIDELLNLSRVSRAPLHRQSVSLTALARTVAQTLAEQQPTRQVSFEAETGVVALADARLLQIVLENLLDNGFKFTARRSDARVRFGRVEGAEPATFFVMDNGAGFDQTYAHRLFQPFQRLHAERDFSGTGIGLAIVHRIVARHGGRIWAEGRENHGATFYFTLGST